jgi:hypothetical protein
LPAGLTGRQTPKFFDNNVPATQLLFRRILHGKNYGFRELTLAEMLRDPIVQDLMRNDGISPPRVKKIFSQRRVQNLALAA